MIEGFWSVFGESELAFDGSSREEMVLSLCVGYILAFFFGTLFGMLADIIGPKKVCLFFWVLHLFIGIWKWTAPNSNLWMGSISFFLSTSIFSVSFETWMVVEHEKLGHGQDTLSDIFWLMTCFESVSFIGSQILANWLVDVNVSNNPVFPPNAAVLLAVIGIICTARGGTETQKKMTLKEYRTSFSLYIFSDKRIWLLACAQAFLYFSVAFLWILWAPTLVADGRGVHLGLLYPCLLGSRMLGSTVFPWLISGSSPLRTEDYLVYAFIVMGLVLFITAYDYQEIGFLLMIFCLFHGFAGISLPSLARLRSIYVPNELRGGMMSLSLAPANAAIVFFLLQGGYHRKLGNATIMAFAALGLFMAAGCMHVLKQSGKRPYQNSHKL